MPVANVVLARNIKATIGDAIVQVTHAQQVKTRARTGYYKVAILLMASTVEALLYDIIDTKCTADPSLWKTVQYRRYTRVDDIKGVNIGLPHDLYICRQDMQDFQLGEKAMLKQMNIFCRDAKFISKKLSKDIDYVMKKRNEIHLQGLTTTNRNYTAAMLERVAKVTYELFRIV
jgi:hypothetical protein